MENQRPLQGMSYVNEYLMFIYHRCIQYTITDVICIRDLHK